MFDPWLTDVAIIASHYSLEGFPIPTPARTSLREIVTTGRRILEAEGLGGLTMQRVASAVGVKAPSLYKRVHGRDHLVRLIVDDVARELTETLDTTAGTGDPRRDLRELAHAVRAFAHAQPASYALLFARLPEAAQPDPDRLAQVGRAVVRTTTVLAGPEHALDAARTVVAWAHGFITAELGGMFRLGGDIDRAYTYGIERLVGALAQDE